MSHLEHKLETNTIAEELDGSESNVLGSFPSKTPTLLPLRPLFMTQSSLPRRQQGSSVGSGLFG